MHRDGARRLENARTVALELSVGSLLHGAVLGPLAEVLEVERIVVRLGQDVEVDVVEAEQIIALRVVGVGAARE